MSVRRWMAEHYRGPVTRRVARRSPRTLAWLEAAWRTLPVFVAIVVASALAEVDVSRFVLAVTWPILTAMLLTVTDQTGGSESPKTNASKPAE